MYPSLKMLFAVLFLILAGGASSSPVLARGWHGGGHGHAMIGVGHRLGGRWYGGFNFYGGPGFGWPYGSLWYPGPVYPGYYDDFYYGPSFSPRVYLSQPPTYIERNAASDWYYCRSARKYYPYIKACAEGWQRVSPQPPAPSSTTTPYYRDPR